MTQNSIITQKAQLISLCRHQFVRAGYFYRKCDDKLIQRFRCKLCGFSKSTATDDICFRQRRREINASICLQLTSGVSQRRCALILPANRKTVVRKFRYFGKLFEQFLVFQNSTKEQVQEMQFDDLETFEHTKCKPLSVTLAVEKKSRRILGFEVASMPCKGKLAKISVRNYGRRKDDRREARDKLFATIQPYIDKNAVIRSDDNPHYINQVKKYFPDCEHISTKGGRGASTGQGELKKQIYDPIFAINHTFAKLRDDLKRLARRNWCTTKVPSQLKLNIVMMAVYHNYRLEEKNSKADFNLIISKMKYLT